MQIARRSFLFGLGASLGASLVAAPAIVRAASLMPVRALKTKTSAEIVNDALRSMARLQDYRAEWLQNWEETAPYIVGQTVITPGTLLICRA